MLQHLNSLTSLIVKLQVLQRREQVLNLRLNTVLIRLIKLARSVNMYGLNVRRACLARIILNILAQLNWQIFVRLSKHTYLEVLRGFLTLRLVRHNIINVALHSIRIASVFRR